MRSPAIADWVTPHRILTTTADPASPRPKDSRRAEMSASVPSLRRPPPRRHQRSCAAVGTTLAWNSSSDGAGRHREAERRKHIFHLEKGLVP